MPSATRKRTYIYNQHQEEPFRGVTSAEEGNLPAAHAITSIKKVIRIRYENGVWYLDLNDGTAETVLTGAYYTPQFRVRAISIKDDDANVVFDTPESEGVIERFIFGLERAFEITRLHLGRLTTATDINLHG